VVTRLQLYCVSEAPPSITQLTALQQLELAAATFAALNQLQPLTGLTHLSVREIRGLSHESEPLQLPDLQHLGLQAGGFGSDMPISLLAGCTELRVLSLHNFFLLGPGSLVVSTMLQHLVLDNCLMAAIWQRVFPCPGQLPHLTSLQLTPERPEVLYEDIEHVVECCSNLQSLKLGAVDDHMCKFVARLTGLRELRLDAQALSDAGFWTLAAAAESGAVDQPNPRPASRAPPSPAGQRLYLAAAVRTTGPLTMHHQQGVCLRLCMCA